jgi:hypothetical protein
MEGRRRAVDQVRTTTRVKALCCGPGWSIEAQRAIPGNMSAATSAVVANATRN